MQSVRQKNSWQSFVFTYIFKLNPNQLVKPLIGRPGTSEAGLQALQHIGANPVNGGGEDLVAGFEVPEYGRRGNPHLVRNGLGSDPVDAPFGRNRQGALDDLGSSGFGRLAQADSLVIDQSQIYRADREPSILLVGEQVSGGESSVDVRNL